MMIGVNLSDPITSGFATQTPTYLSYLIHEDRHLMLLYLNISNATCPSDWALGLLLVVNIGNEGGEEAKKGHAFRVMAMKHHHHHHPGTPKLPRTPAERSHYRL